MNREQSKNYFENKITAQPFDHTPSAQPVVTVPDITQPSGAMADLTIYQTNERPFKIFAGITTIPVIVVFVISIAIVIFKGIETPTYLPLLINLILIILVTGLVYFWYFRGTMSYTMIWYIVIYAILTVLQCIFIDVFALVTVSPSSGPVTPRTIPAIPINSSNTTKHLLFTNPTTTISQLDLS